MHTHSSLPRHLAFARIAVGAMLIACSWVQAADGVTYESAYAAYQTQEFDRAEAEWEELARGGNARAQYALAVMHLKGETAHPDPAAAFRLLQNAAKQGHATAMFNLGIAFWEGTGTKQDRQQALEWWQQAADQGDVGAQYNLGLTYYIGERQPQDLEKAAHWLSAAAAAKHPEAEKVLRMIESEKNLSAMRSDGSAPADDAAAILSKPAPPVSMERAPVSADMGKQAATPAAESPAAPAAEPAKTYWQTAGEAALYPTRDLQEPVMATLAAGTPVEILEQQKARARITIPGGIALWVYGKYVTADGGQDALNQGVINATSVNARPLPDTDNRKAPPVGRFKKGDKVTIVETRGKWAQVRAPARLGAWVDSGNLVQYADTPDNRKQAWEAAASQP
ncbi:MAG: hypothetical protein U9Q71_07090 [Pseudomonadota bacterium]|nr:hypothetical protein [Pseudomonadota bacterium]